MAREDRDTKKMSNLLVIANERLQGETVRANEAERKTTELIRRFKEVIQGRDVALQDSARFSEVSFVLLLLSKPLSDSR